MVRYQNLTRKPELFRAPLGPGTMYPLNPPLAGPGHDSPGLPVATALSRPMVSVQRLQFRVTELVQCSL